MKLDGQQGSCRDGHGRERVGVAGVHVGRCRGSTTRSICSVVPSRLDILSHCAAGQLARALARVLSLGVSLSSRSSIGTSSTKILIAEVTTFISL